MFYLSSLSKDICIYPKDLGCDIKSLISEKIRELEGTVMGSHGYIVSIVEFNQTSKGKVDNETGRVNYRIMYKAITFKPVIDEILDTFPVFINEHGFFCKVGLLQIFVSQHIMENMRYNSTNKTWIYPNNQVIDMDKLVRIQIIAFKINSNEITALGKLFDQPTD